MRFTVNLCFGCVLLFSGCAFQGTVLQKEFRPLPFYDSLGLEGIYRFELRDRAGQIHSQTVTPEVFASYAPGDYFNDLERPAASRVPQGAPLSPLLRRRPLQYYETPYRPLRTTRTQANTPRQIARAVARHRPVAGSHRRTVRKTSIAKRKHAVRTARNAKHKKHTKLARFHRSRLDEHFVAGGP